MRTGVLLAFLAILAVPQARGSMSTESGTYGVGSAGSPGSRKITLTVDTEDGRVQRERAALGVPIPVEGVDFPIQRTAARGQVADAEELDAVSDRLERTILKDVDFRNASVLDVLKLLQRACDEQNPPGERVTFVLQHRDKSTVEGTPVFEAPDEAIRADAQFTFTVNRIPVADVLTILCKLSGATFSVGRGGVVAVRTWGVVNCSNDVYRLFSLPPRVLELVDRAPVKGDWSEDRLKEYLAVLGVELPEGTSLEYHLGGGKLLVTGTVSACEMLERALVFLNEAPPRPGRFRLHGTAGEDGAGNVFLLDTDTGRTWRYCPKGEVIEGTLFRNERFVLVPDVGP